MRITKLPIVMSLAFSLFGAVALARAGDNVMISDARIRALPPGTPNSAAYFSIENDGKTDLEIVKVFSPIANITELHETIDRDGTLLMVRHDKVVIPAGESVEFKPGSLHVMLMKLKNDLVVGEQIPMTLIFQGGDEMQFVARVSMLAPMAEPEMAHRH